MRDGINEQWTEALASQGIRTGLLGWFDFKSSPVGVWTGWRSIKPMGTGDSILDGKTFDPFAEGIPVSVGDNTYSYTGSDALDINLAAPGELTPEMVYASLDPEEYQGRTAIIWRALMVTLPTATQPAEWAFRRVRAGVMDSLKITHTGDQFIFNLTIEAHASMMTNATGSSYLDQPKFDPSDTSQNYAVSIANNPQTPGRGSYTRDAIFGIKAVYDADGNRTGYIR